MSFFSRKKLRRGIAVGFFGLGAGKRPLALTYIYPTERPHFRILKKYERLFFF